MDVRGIASDFGKVCGRRLGLLDVINGRCRYGYFGSIRYKTNMGNDSV